MKMLSLKESSVLLFIAGALQVLSFAPFFHWWLSFICLAVFFHALLHTHNVKHAMWYAWLYHFATLFVGVIWLSVTMFRYGHLPVGLAVFLVALFTGAIALIPLCYIGALIYCKRYFSDVGLCLVGLPLAWALSEWTHGWLFTGFPWLVSGYAHTVGPLRGYAPILGVYGITWIVACLSGCIVLLWQKRHLLLDFLHNLLHMRDLRWGAPRNPNVHVIHSGLWSVPPQLTLARYGYASSLLVGLFMLVLLLGWGLDKISWTTPYGQAITVSLLQGNVDQALKFNYQHTNNTLLYYQQAITEQKAQLIVTPESALARPFTQLPPGYIDHLQRFSNTTKSVLALGTFGQASNGLFTNSVIGVMPLEKQVYRYDKYHLVPFGEFIPTGFNWFYHYVNIPMANLYRGSFEAQPLAVHDQFILPSICYEDVFGEEIAAKIFHQYQTQQSVPTILLNMTNIAWFGDSFAPPQHLQIAQMRALETKRPMLRATNTGVTAFIDHNGHVVQQLPVFERGHLVVRVQGYEGRTPYIMWRNNGWLVLAGLVMLAYSISRFCRFRLL